MIDRTRVADGYLFATHGDRCFYLGKSARDRLHWLKENPGKWRSAVDYKEKAARLRPPVESETNLEAGPAEPNGQTSSHDVRKDGGEESDVTLVDAPAGGRSPPYQPTTLPVPVQAIIKGTTKAELLPPANAAMSETKEPKTETTPLGAVGPKRGRRRGRQPENQKHQRKSRKPAECYRLSACELSSTALRKSPYFTTQLPRHSSQNT